MANISSAFGTMTLVGEWTQDMVDKLNVLSGAWETWYYNISADPFKANHNPVVFVATGRWWFGGTIESIGEWTRTHLH